MLYNLYKLVQTKRRDFPVPAHLFTLCCYPMPNETTHLPPQDARAAMAQLDRELNRLQRAIRLAIQAQLETMSGCSLGSLEQNRNLTESIHQLLESHGLRVRCNECGHPAILRVSPRGSSHGVFVFDHTIDGHRTFHGGKSSLPLIRLVAKPPRKKKSKGRAAG